MYQINDSEEIDINKSNKPKECLICHYWYILDNSYKSELYVCDGSHDISMMAYELENLEIIKDIEYRCVSWNMTRSDAINRLSNSELDDKE